MLSHEQVPQVFSRLYEMKPNIKAAVHNHPEKKQLKYEKPQKRKSKSKAPPSRGTSQQRSTGSAAEEKKKGKAKLDKSMRKVSAQY